MKDRQAAVDRFQKDPECRLFIGGIQAAGVGITLTAASHVVFAELDWVPGNITQAEDRCHRIGQMENVLVQHLVLAGSMDAKLAQTLVSKQEIIEKAMDEEFSFEPVMPGKSDALQVSRKQVEKEKTEITQDQVAAAHEGLQLLARVCDGAHEKDDSGFNAADTEFGKYLARLPMLTLRMGVVARKMCLKYKRQLPADLIGRLK